MKKLLASASLLVLSSASAMAADLPMKAAPYMAPAPLFSWTGCYLGVHAGGGVMSAPISSEGSSGSGTNGSGGLAGGQLGCNYQEGNWVFGIEGEGYWSGMKSTSGFHQGNSEGFTASTIAAKNKADYSIAARAGIAFDRTLVYGKAGWVWGKFDIAGTFSDDCCSLNGGPFLATQVSSGTLNGLLVGVGVEHALTQNWTVKLEYNYLKFGSKELPFVSCNNDSIPACISGTSSFQADKHIFKIGANYLFNWGGAPLLAKY
jgi:outer membrane immunogenic protein